MANNTKYRCKKQGKLREEGFHVIACSTVAEELKALGVPRERLKVLDFGLHVNPVRLKEALQAEIGSMETGGDILLGYGLCSHATVGLRSRKCRLVIPRVDDCIALFLGSREEHLRRLSEEPGAFFLTKGWIEAGMGLYQEYLKLVERYGEKRAARVVKSLFSNYQRVNLINTGNYEMDKYRRFARCMAEFLGLEFEEIQGSNRLLKKMLSGEWDSEFVVVSPNEEINLSAFQGET